jgi:hypothetical protein
MSFEIQEMPILWRCMFYQALTPRIAMMLKRAPLAQEGVGDITNATLESGV